MKRHLHPILVLTVLLAAAPALGQTARPEPSKRGDLPKAAQIDPAEWAPADALFYLGITDVGQVWRDFQKTGAYELLSGQAGTEGLPQVDVLGDTLRALRQRLADVLGVTPDDLQNPFDGPLTFYIVPTLGKGMPKLADSVPGLVAGVGDAALLRRYYDAVVGKLKEQCQHESVSVGTDFIDVFTAPEAGKKAAAADDDFADFDAGGSSLMDLPMKLKKSVDALLAGDALPPKLAMCLTEERLVVADTAQAVKAVLQKEQRDRSLADLDDYKALHEHLRPVGPIRFLVSIPRLVKLAEADAKKGDEDTQKTLKMFAVDTLGSLVGHGRFGAASYESKIDMLLLTHDRNAGLMKLLLQENLPVTPPAHVGAETFIFASLNVAVVQLLNDLEFILRRGGDAEAADAVKNALEIKQESGETVNLRKALLSYLKGPYVFNLGLTQPVGPKSSVVALLSCGHTDQAALNQALANPAITQLELTKRDLRGTAVYDLPPLPPLMVAGATAAASKDLFYLGLSAATEKALAEPPAERLADSPAWKRAARFLPEQAWAVVYIDEHAMTEALLTLANAPPDAEMAGGMDLGGMVRMGMVQSMRMKAPGVDLTNTAPLLKNLAQQVVALSASPAGLQFTAVKLKPEKRPEETAEKQP